MYFNSQTGKTGLALSSRCVSLGRAAPLDARTITAVWTQVRWQWWVGGALLIVWECSTGLAWAATPCNDLSCIAEITQQRIREIDDDIASWATINLLAQVL